MFKNRLILAFIAIFICQVSFTQQKILNLPVCCTKPFIAIDVRLELQKDPQKTKKNTPWVVYSDRGPDFGKEYYVIQEDGGKVLICPEKKLDGNSYVGVGKTEWREKTELMVRLSSELMNNATIHKKCVVLNNNDVLEEIIKGNLRESDIPLYNNPNATTPIDSIPLYFMYFIYKTENGRFLIGRNYKYEEEFPFKKQIFGWVDAKRVYQYNTRICYEPNFEQQAIKQRRCTTNLEATVYQNWDPNKEQFSGGKIWIEPDHWYLFDSDGITDTSIVQDKLRKLCATAPGSPDFSSLFSTEYLPGIKFRFPLIQAENENVFMLGCTGRYDESRMVKEEKCAKLNENKRKLNITLIIDQELKSTKALNFLEQIDSKGKEFTKKYGVCIFPRPDYGDQWLTIGSSYAEARDYIKIHNPGENILPGDNCINTLDLILNKESSLNPLETNVFIILNASKVPDIQATSELYKRLQNNIVGKNCYIIAFDYYQNSGLIPKLKEIMIKAANSYAYKYNLDAKPVFNEQNNIFTLNNSGILAVLTTGKPTSAVVEQVSAFIPIALDHILKTVNDAISFNCLKGTGNSQTRESPFAKVIGDLEQSSVILSVRAMQKGYSVMNGAKNKDGIFDMWKAEVLMTESELTELITLMGTYSKISPSQSDQASMIYELWIQLSKRFVGEKVLNEEALLNRTPKEILEYMVGGYFGYTNTGNVLKNYTLRDIKEQTSDVVRNFKPYIQEVSLHKKELEEIKDKKRLEFKNTRENEDESNISYFWIPIDKLP